MQNVNSASGLNHEAFFKISYGLYIICTKSGNRMNGYVSNTVFQVTSTPAQFAICCSKDNLTAEMISQNGFFTASVLGRDAGKELISLFGYQSGRDVDKFAKTKYIMTESGVPAVTEDSLAWFECKVKQTIDAGTHILFIAEILRTEVTDNKNEPLTYAWYRDQRKGKAPKNAPSYIETDEPAAAADTAVKYKCVVCGHIYDPAAGDPESGIPAGTDFKSLPEDWKCPICGAARENFEAII